MPRTPSPMLRTTPSTYSRPPPNTRCSFSRGLYFLLHIPSLSSSPFWQSTDHYLRLTLGIMELEMVNMLIQRTSRAHTPYVWVIITWEAPPCNPQHNLFIWGDFRSQGTAGAIRARRRLEDSSLEPTGGAWLYLLLHFAPMASRTMEV